jgi:hypothetical protein
VSWDAWTDEEAAVQSECWSHGFVLTYDDLAAEVERRRDDADGCMSADGCMRCTEECTDGGTEESP